MYINDIIIPSREKMTKIGVHVSWLLTLVKYDGFEWICQHQLIIIKKKKNTSTNSFLAFSYLFIVQPVYVDNFLMNLDR